MSSAFSGTVKVADKNIIQQVVVPFTPSASQDLTTTHQDVDGSSYDFTPVSANSKIVYSYGFVIKSVSGSANDYLVHFKLLVDGVLQSGSECTSRTNGTLGNMNTFFFYEHTVDSWGATTKTIKMQAREYSSAFLTALHEGIHWDGTATAKTKVATLIITEYAETNYVVPDFTDPPAGTILQSVVQEYVPTAKQSLTTVHSDINGSDYTFTPVSASSEIVYEYHFYISGDNGGTADGIAHFKLINNGTLATKSETTWRSTYFGGSNLYASSMFTYKYMISSWGTSAQVLKMQGREYSATFPIKLHEIYHWDGGSSNELRNAVLTITEYAT